MDYKEKDYYKGVKIAKQITDIMLSNQEIGSTELNEWLESDSTSKVVINKLSSEESLSKLCSEFKRGDESNKEASRLFNVLNGRIERRKNFYRLCAGAIVAAVLATIFISLYNSKDDSLNPTVIVAQNNEQQQLTTDSIIVCDISKPTLVLDGGDNIDLSTHKDKIIDNGTVISKSNKNELNYSNKNEENPSKTAITTYNTLKIPKELSYSVILEDGTTVYLNASSELRYPIRFNKTTREVFLKGEAYFDVKKSDKPFVVNVNNLRVRVYGTKFNINSYDKESIKTALIEGSIGVSIKNDKTEKELIMKPNQLLSFDEDNVAKLVDVDTKKYISWMDGYIKSYDEPLVNLLSRISNWYGVEFIYDKDKENINIFASLSNKRPLEELIESLKIITGVEIIKNIEGKYVIL